MKKAAVLLDNGFEELEAMGPIALLRRGGVEVDLVSVENKNEATGRFGVTYAPAVPMNEYDFSKADALILPGGPQYKTLESNPAVIEQIKAFAANPDKILAAICASPTILGRLGLLENKDYTCFTAMNEDFGGNYHARYAVKDGNLITGRSAAAAIDFAFEILAALQGDQKAQEVKESIYY
jgi:4-methyl-5(b-hydroxyethyl)-thiazole monophosphate biosynthesis